MCLNIANKRKILRLIAETTLSDRKIARQMRCSSTTVGSLRKFLGKSSISWEQIAVQSDYEFVRLLNNRRTTSSDRIIPDWSLLHQELQHHPNLTLQRLHIEYVATIPDPNKRISYSYFTEKYREWLNKQKISMRQVHRPGEKIYIDFCGTTMPVYDQRNGGVTKVQIFVAVLGYSGKIFAYATPSQKIVDWLDCHNRMFEFFGGVAEELVPDNLKSAVNKHTPNELIINSKYLDLADHYGCAINPARVRRPQDKSLAEIGVRVVQMTVLASLRKIKIFSIEELNREILFRINKINSSTTKRYTQSREELYLQTEFPALAPLPATPYILENRKYSVRVPSDYHVEYKKYFYSVPYRYIGSHVDLVATANTLEILLSSGERIASHELLTDHRKGYASTMPEHRAQRENERDELKRWAAEIGANTKTWVEALLESKRNYANSLRSIKSMRKFVRENQLINDLEPACTFALDHNMMEPTVLRTILKNRTFAMPVTDTTAWVKTHPNIRGTKYYSH